MTGKYTTNYFNYKSDVGCVCMLNDWISSSDAICADNYNYFQFKLKGNGRSEKWQIYLYGDKSMAVKRQGVEVLSRGVPPPGIGGVGFDSSPNVAAKHTIYELCLPSERGMDMEMNLADPVSGGDYSGTCVSAAPTFEPAVMSFTVPLTGSVIAVTKTAVTTCSSSDDCTDSSAPMCSDNICVAMSCSGGSFTPDGLYDSSWDSVTPMTGKYTTNYFNYKSDVGCVCMLNDWISSSDAICADNYNYFQFKLKGNGRSEKWQIYLYGDKSMAVKRQGVEVLSRGVPPPGIGGVGFDSSPNVAAKHTIYELCLPSERGMDMEMNLADPVSGGDYSGTCVSTPPVDEPNVVTFTVPLTGSTISAVMTSTVTSVVSQTSVVSAKTTATQATTSLGRYLTFSWTFTITISVSSTYVSQYGALHKAAVKTWVTSLLSGFSGITIVSSAPVAVRRLTESVDLDAEVPEFQLRRLSTTVTSDVEVDSGSNDADTISSVVTSADTGDLITELCSEGVDCTAIESIGSPTVTSSESSAVTTTAAAATTIAATTGTVTVTLTEAPEAISGVLTWFLIALGVGLLALMFGAVGSFLVWMFNSSEDGVQATGEGARLLVRP